MHETYISFYLNTYRIYLFKKSIAEIGNPKYVRLLMNANCLSLAVQAYDKKDFQSYRIKYSMDHVDRAEINSFMLCRLIQNRLRWDGTRSYRVPGIVYPKDHVVIFNLTEAQQI